MSGGRFEYKQNNINYIADQIEEVVLKNSKKKIDNKYPVEVIEKFKEGIDILQKAAIYAQRIDWLLSGDDGEETFLERLKKDLDKL
jgi:hypothetical protein